MTKKEIASKIGFQILGMFIYGLGIAGIVIAGAGASPVDAVANYTWVLTKVLTHPIWLFLYNGLFALIVFAFTKKGKVFYTLIISFIISQFFNLGIWIFQLIFNNVDFSNKYQTIMSVYGSNENGLNFGGIALSYGIAILGLILLAFGLGLLISKNLVLTPFDELAVFIQNKTGNFAVAKSILDGTAFIIAVILGLIINSVFSQINVFSIIIVFTLGPLIGMFAKILKGEKKNEIEQIY